MSNQSAAFVYAYKNDLQTHQSGLLKILETIISVSNTLSESDLKKASCRNSIVFAATAMFTTVGITNSFKV
jgi:hypothetical protein